MAQMLKDLRNENRNKICQEFLNEQVITRAELTEKTGISLPTVVRIVEELLSIGFLLETVIKSNSLGRKPSGLIIDKNYVVFASIFHEGEKLCAGISNLHGELLYIKEFKTNNNFEKLIAYDSIHIIEEMLHELAIDKIRLKGIGIAIPVIVNSHKNYLIEAPQISVSEGLDLNECLSKLKSHFNTDVQLENDVNAMAVGEHFIRKLRDSFDMAYLSLGTGVGCGLILEGKLRRGPNNMAGEIGYTHTDANDMQRENMGDLDNKIGLKGLEKKYHSYFSEEIPLELKEQLSVYVLRILAHAIINICALIDLDVVVLGGSTIDLLDKHFDKQLEARIKKLVQLPICLERGTVKCPGLVGMGILMRNKMFVRLQEEGVCVMKIND